VDEPKFCAEHSATTHSSEPSPSVRPVSLLLSHKHERSVVSSHDDPKDSEMNWLMQLRAQFGVCARMYVGSGDNDPPAEVRPKLQSNISKMIKDMLSED